MRYHVAAALAAAALFVLPSTASAGAVQAGFTGGGTVVNADDSFTGPVNVGFNVNYFGNTFAQAYLGTNGYITFGAGQTGFTPVGLGAGYSGSPIIAAFYADVDTRNGGVTSYGNGTVDGRNAFGVTYNNVSYFGATGSNRNTFQILLVDRADTGTANFDIVLNYDQILWETGTANNGNAATGRGGASASVGYNAGTGNQAGTYFAFAGSQVNGAFLDGGPNSLTANSNVGVAGRYVFTVRGGNVEPVQGVPEPATWAMMIAGFGLVGATMRRRSTKVAFA